MRMESLKITPNAILSRNLAVVVAARWLFACRASQWGGGMPGKSWLGAVPHCIEVFAANPDNLFESTPWISTLSSRQPPPTARVTSTSKPDCRRRSGSAGLAHDRGAHRRAAAAGCRPPVDRRGAVAAFFWNAGPTISRARSRGFAAG